jgi:hypothetical protein
MSRQKKPAAEAADLSALGVRKKRGRKKDLRSERKRITASVTVHVYRINAAFEQPITKLKTKFDKIMNKHPGSYASGMSDGLFQFYQIFRHFTAAD